MPIAHLEDRAMLEASGADARNFLNGLITHDVVNLQSGQAVWAGLLSPQGKALFDFIVFGTNENSLLIEAEACRIAELTRRLGMYKLRAAVTLTSRPDLLVYAGWQDAALEGAMADPRLPAVGWRFIGHVQTTLDASLQDYTYHRLCLGVPEGSADIGIDSLLWLETNADKLNGVSFTKGCYVGQENTARMFHRHKVRKRLMAVSLPELAPDEKLIMSGTHEAGTLRSQCNTVGLALLRQDYVDSVLDIAGKPVSIIKQGWLDV